jgi:hypothetical protein
MTVLHRLLIFGIIAALIFAPSIGAVFGQQVNVGMLRVASFLCPREVAPDAIFPLSLDVEYAIRGLPDNVTIRSAIYSGSMGSSTPLWESDPTFVSDGGDKVWNLTLTAPASEGVFNLTAYAFFRANGTWVFFDNSVNGPGFRQATVKISKTANIDIFVGAQDVDVSIANVTVKTSSSGDASMTVAVGSAPLVSIPRIVEFQNSTRIIFTAWSDGVAQPQRRVPIDGDIALIANYRTQYLLRVNSVSTSERWYDKGTNATLSTPASAPMVWPLSLLGMKENFVGWSGDIESSLTQLNITMDSPKNVDAQFSIDYRPLAVPLILALGVAVAVLSLVFLRRRLTAAPRPPDAPVPEEALVLQDAPVGAQNTTCPNCRQLTEEDWVHCIKCGTKLRN